VDSHLILAPQGITPSPGGTHAGLGTHNRLAALGNGAYLEILARDPGQRECQLLPLI
jgi:hypothetical protein